MRKRSKYRPKPVYLNAVQRVLDAVAPVSKHSNWLIDLQIKNHGAMAALMRGQATRNDMTTLIAMHNMIEALWRKGFAKDYEDVITDGYQSLMAVIERGLKNGDRFILRAEEIAALNLHMELHDELMLVTCVRDIDQAIDLIKREHKAGRTTRIIDFMKDKTHAQGPDTTTATG